MLRPSMPPSLVLSDTTTLSKPRLARRPAGQPLEGSGRCTLRSSRGGVDQTVASLPRGLPAVGFESVACLVTVGIAEESGELDLQHVSLDREVQAAAFP